MKKVGIIFLLFIYASSVLGLSVKANYCCSNLTSLKLVLADGAKDKEGCCKVKYQSLKVRDAHSAADIIVAPALQFSFIHTLNSFFAITDFSGAEKGQFVNIHAPPLDPRPAYISNCVFRI